MPATTQAAARAFSAIAGGTPEPRVALALGRTAAIQGDIDQATYWLEQGAAASDRVRPLHRFELGRLYYRAHRTDEALAQWRAGGPSQALHFYFVADQCFKESRLEAARKNVVIGLQLDGTQPRFWKLLGDVELAYGSPKEARQAYEETIRLAPEWAEPHINLGRLLQVHSPEEGNLVLQLLQDGVKRDPRNVWGYIFMAGEYADRGQLQDAATAVKNAMSLCTPVCPPAPLGGWPGRPAQMHRDLAQRLLVLDSLEEAEGQARVAVALEPGDREILLQLAEILARRGSYDESYTHARSILQADPSNLRAQRLLP